MKAAVIIFFVVIFLLIFFRLFLVLSGMAGERSAEYYQNEIRHYENLNKRQEALDK